MSKQTPNSINLGELTRSIYEPMMEQLAEDVARHNAMVKWFGMPSDPRPTYGPARPRVVFAGTLDVEWGDEFHDDPDIICQINSGGWESETARLTRDEARELAHLLLRWVGDE